MNASSTISQTEEVYRIVEKVRFDTGVSHNDACRAVHVTLNNLHRLNVDSSPISQNVIDSILNPIEAPSSLIDDTQDMNKLVTIAADLDSMKNDYQQRSWELFDDIGTIINCLEDFNSTLKDADPAISRRFLHVTEYYIVDSMAEYYQMEGKWTIRTILLKTFDLLCCLSQTVCSVFLQSVIPLEFTRDIQNYLNDEAKLTSLISVFTKMLSVGQLLPVMYFETINKEFLVNLLKKIENLSDTDKEDIVERLIDFIVVYNLQFDDRIPVSENITMQAISEIDNPKIFSESILFFFNRGKDAVKNEEYTNEYIKWLVKMITDLFSHEKNHSIFYNNDVKVLIDLVLRRLTDEVDELQEKIKSLNLLRLVLLKSDKSVFCDRVSEIKDCIEEISVDEDTELFKIVNDITKVISEKLD